MIPKYYFDVISCPKCGSNLRQNSEKEIICSACHTKYPVIDDIPILLENANDEVSNIIKSFYDTEWERNKDGVIKARLKHEDLSDLGQKYIKMNEDRFLSSFNVDDGCDYFLDAASGAQPRVEFGSKYTYHICVDFSVDGLIESRKILGDRAICVCGSLLNLPLKDMTCNAIIASHSIYHIDEKLQSTAIEQLHRVQRDEGTLLVFYGNPDSIENLTVKVLKKLMQKENTTKGKDFYYFSHNNKDMVNILSLYYKNSSIDVKPLRMLTRRTTQFPFSIKILGIIFFNILTKAEFLLWKFTPLYSYVAFTAKK